MEFAIFDEQYRCRTKDYFWFQETRQAIQTIVDKGMAVDDIASLSDMDNFFSAVSKGRAKETAQGVIRRLKVANDEFFRFFIEQSIEQQKLLVMVLIMVEDRTAFEFMNEVFKEKLILGDLTLSDGNVIGFIHSIQAKDTKAAEWSDGSVKKLRTCLKGFLRESGLAVSEGRNLKIVRPILDQRFTDFLYHEDLDVITKIFAGER